MWPKKGKKISEKDLFFIIPSKGEKRDEGNPANPPITGKKVSHSLYLVKGKNI